MSFSFVSQCKCLDPKNQGKPAASCGSAEYKGDGNCDDNNNNKGCEFDGGDCCDKSVKGGKVKKDYCKEVGCDYLGCACRIAISCFIGCSCMCQLVHGLVCSNHIRVT